MIEQLRLVEVEIHSYCNRSCSWCPNSYIDRKTKQELPEEVFLKLMDELAEAGYDQFISFSRYNEPLSDQALLRKRVLQAKERLPNATMVCNTNGDYYFSQDYLGIDQLTVMLYDGGTESIAEDGHIRFMKLGDVNNRGGALTLDSKKRTNPCYEPKFFVGIDYDGSVMPCCNLRHDVPEHAKYVLGNISSQPLEKILNGSKAKLFRKMTSRGGLCLPEPCKECSKEPGRYTRENPGIGD